jgi:hypothetical protein
VKLEGKIEAVVALLFIGVMVGLLFLFIAEKMFPNDGQIFQVVSGVISVFLGALAAKIDPRKQVPTGTGVTDPQTSQATIVTKEVAKGPDA